MFHVEHKSFPHSYNLRGKIFEVFNFRMKYSNFLLILFYRYSIIKMCNGIILEPSQDWKIAALTKCAVCTFFIYYMWKTIFSRTFVRENIEIIQNYI